MPINNWWSKNQDVVKKKKKHRKYTRLTNYRSKVFIATLMQMSGGKQSGNKNSVAEVESSNDGTIVQRSQASQWDIVVPQAKAGC